MTDLPVEAASISTKQRAQDDFLPRSLATRAMFWRPAYLAPSAWHEHIPFAFWLVQAMRPGVFVELGSHYGVSYFAFCQAVARLDLGTRCYAVDTWKGDEHAGYYDEQVFEQVSKHNRENYSGFSSLVRSTFDEACPQFADASIDLLHIDGLHGYEAVRHDFEMWLPRMTDKGVVLLHDTNVREREFGVSRLFDELKERYRHFEFPHGHGLGVICVGDVDPPLEEFFGAVEDHSSRQAVCELFSNLGHSCALAFNARSAETRIGELQQAAAQLEQSKLESVGLRERLASETGADRQRIAHLEQALETKSTELAGIDAAAQTARIELQQMSTDAATSQEESERKTRELAVLTEMLEQQRHAVVQLQLSLDVAERRLGEMRSSSSWKITGPLRWALRPVSKIKNNRRVKRQVALIESYGEFDKAWYVEQYPEIADSGLAPVEHYVRLGANEGKRPNPGFDTAFYTQSYPDIAESGFNPFVHYLEHGRAEGRKTSG